MVIQDALEEAAAIHESRKHVLDDSSSLGPLYL